MMDKLASEATVVRCLLAPSFFRGYGNYGKNFLLVRVYSSDQSWYGRQTHLEATWRKGRHLPWNGDTPRIV